MSPASHDAPHPSRRWRSVKCCASPATGLHDTPASQPRPRPGFPVWLATQRAWEMNSAASGAQRGDAVGRLHQYGGREVGDRQHARLPSCRAIHAMALHGVIAYGTHPACH